MPQSFGKYSSQSILCRCVFPFGEFVKAPSVCMTAPEMPEMLTSLFAAYDREVSTALFIQTTITLSPGTMLGPIGLDQFSSLNV